MHDPKDEQLEILCEKLSVPEKEEGESETINLFLMQEYFLLHPASLVVRHTLLVTKVDLKKLAHFWSVKILVKRPNI